MNFENDTNEFIVGKKLEKSTMVFSFFFLFLRDQPRERERGERSIPWLASLSSINFSRASGATRTRRLIASAFHRRVNPRWSFLSVEKRTFFQHRRNTGPKRREGTGVIFSRAIEDGARLYYLRSALARRCLLSIERNDVDGRLFTLNVSRGLGGTRLERTAGNNSRIVRLEPRHYRKSVFARTLRDIKTRGYFFRRWCLSSIQLPTTKVTEIIYPSPRRFVRLFRGSANPLISGRIVRGCSRGIAET